MPFFTNRAITPLPVDAGAAIVLDVPLGGNNAGWGSYTMVQRIPASELGAGSGTEMRITVNLATLDTGAPPAEFQLYVGQSATSGDAYDFAGTPAQVLFAASGTVVGDGVTLFWISDWVTLPEAYDETKDYSLAIQFQGAGAADLTIAAMTGATTWYKTGVDAVTTNKTGYTSAFTDYLSIATKIEVQ